MGFGKTRVRSNAESGQIRNRTTNGCNRLDGLPYFDRFIIYRYLI